MAIFKIFNPDWSFVPEKLTSPSKNNCNCATLKKLVQEKDEALEALTNKTEFLENQLKECKEKKEKLKSENLQFYQILTDVDSILTDMSNERTIYKNAKDTTAQHLANLEFYFNDVHTKYERTKSIVQEFKENENILKNCLIANEETIITLQNRYQQLKDMSEQKLFEANETLNEMNKANEEEMNRMKTKIKKLEVIIGSLELSLQQKSIENEQLLHICDEFILNRK